MERTIGYRIESCMIPQTPGIFRRRWFLDRVIETDRGRSTSNICNGDRAYCMIELLKAKAAEQVLQPRREAVMAETCEESTFIADGVLGGPGTGTAETAEAQGANRCPQS